MRYVHHYRPAGSVKQNQVSTMSKESIPSSDILDTCQDGRKCPRIVMGCPMTLSLPGGEKVEAILYDISLTGLQIWIGIREADGINIQPDNTNMENTTVLETGFQLTVNEKVQEINLLAIPLHLKKIHEDYLAIGMQIIKMDKKNVDTLEEFIGTSMDKS